VRVTQIYEVRFTSRSQRCEKCGAKTRALVTVNGRWAAWCGCNESKRVTKKRQRELTFTDEHWAVFNLHVNKAGERAFEIVRQRYETHPDFERLERAYKDGIMAIFNRKPNDVSRFFAMLVWVFANKLEV